MSRFKNSLLFTASLFLLVFALSAFQTADGKPAKQTQQAKKKFEQLDKNGDGKLERKEFPGDDLLFQRADLDGDGVIVFQEALNFILEQEVEKIFLQFDKNRDGLITREEITEEKHRRNFDAIDKNMDNKLTGSEVLAALKGNMKAESAPAKMGKVKQPPSWEKLLGQFDKDKNGSIEKAESNSELNKVFGKIDANSDGTLTQAEYDGLRNRYLGVLKRVESLKMIFKKSGPEIEKALKDVNLERAEKSLAKLEAELQSYLKSLQQSREPH